MKQRFQALKGKKVFVTGHTGFTGSWACIWLNQIGCEVFGYSLEPETTPNLFTEAKVGELVSGTIADIRNFDALRDEIAKFQPDLVLHLAAQPLVRRSYSFPRETFEINTQGTANLLDAVRGVASIKGVLCITTDKVYKNLETHKSYVESDELGGKDPYSASKSAAEHVITSYRSSFRGSSTEYPLVAVARGGNIVGGGDWSEDRLVPDFIRAHFSKQVLKLRFPHATRPWQHVLSLVDGYLSILEGLVSEKSKSFDQAFNLGPTDSSQINVKEVLDLLSFHITDVRIETEVPNLPEAEKLSLDSTLAIETFGWQSRWGMSEIIEKTATWYGDVLYGGIPAREKCVEQIFEWESYVE